MTELQGEFSVPAAEERFAGQAHRLGQQHRSAAVSPTTGNNASGRQRLASAYCDALEGHEPGDDGPGS
jgi:hypothetical protein